MEWGLVGKRIAFLVFPGNHRCPPRGPRTFPIHCPSSATTNGRGFTSTRRLPPPCLARSRLLAECTPRLDHLSYLRSFCLCFRFLSHSSRRHGLDRVPVGRTKPASCSCRADKLSGPPLPFESIVEIVAEDGEDVEVRLTRLNPGLSLAMVKDVLRILSDLRVPSLRFFKWTVGSARSFALDAEIYNLVVDNLGWVEDFESMSSFLKGLSDNGHCLTQRAFTFVTVDPSSDAGKDLVGKVVATLNGVRGSCRGSGIHALIRSLCSCGNYDIALSVIKETETKYSYFNEIIVAKCRQGDLQGAADVLVEMRRLDCSPTTGSYNYLLGSFFKNKRFDEGCDLLQAMEESGLRPDPLTFDVMVFHACKFTSTDLAMQLVDKMLLGGLKPRLTTHAVVIKSHFQSGRASDASKYVVDMSIRDRCSTAANYSLLARLFWVSKRLLEAGGILDEMMEKGVKPNFSVYMKIVRGLYKLGRGDFALELKSKFSKFPLPLRAR